MNSLYNSMQPQRNDSMLQAFQQFRSNFKGNPKEQVQQLLNSGRMSQAEYNRLSQIAQQFQNLFK